MKRIFKNKNYATKIKSIFFFGTIFALFLIVVFFSNEKIEEFPLIEAKSLEEIQQKIAENKASETSAMTPTSSPLVHKTCYTGLRKQVQSLRDQVDDLAAKVNCTTLENMHCQLGANLPSHSLKGGFTTDVDFLYWKANEDGLEYGTKFVSRPVGTPITANAKLLDLHFEWDPGLRINMGYIFPQFENWELNLTWTHIRNHAHAQAKSNGVESQVSNTDTIIPPWVTLLFELRFGVSQANTKWTLNFNTLDLALGRSFSLSKRIVMNPYFGFRGAWVDQHYNAKYNTVFIPEEDAPTFNRLVNFKAKNDFRAFGIQSGAGFIWHFSKHWNLFTDLSGNLLYGKFNVKAKNLGDRGLGQGEVPPAPLDLKTSEKFFRIRLNFEEAIGLAWESFYNQDRYFVSVKIAYELSQWLNQNELYYLWYFRGTDTVSAMPVRSNGNLGLQGIRAGMRFDF